jgi:hypothetical protein
VSPSFSTSVAPPGVSPRPVGDQILIHRDVVGGHARRREALLEFAANAGAGQRRQPADRGHRLVDAPDDEAREAIREDFVDRSSFPGDRRGAAGHRFDHHEAEGLAPVDQKKQGARARNESPFLRIAHFANEFHGRLPQERFDLLVVVRLVGLADLGRDAETHARPARHFNRPINALLGRDAAEEQQVVAAPIARHEQVGGQAVIDRRVPARVRQGLALVVGNRHDRHVLVFVVQRRQVFQIEPPVQRRDVWHVRSAAERKMQIVDVIVHDVVRGDVTPDPFDHQHVVRQRIDRVRIEPQRLGRDGHEPGRRARIRA